MSDQIRPRMTLNEYQDAASRTAARPVRDFADYETPGLRMELARIDPYYVRDGINEAVDQLVWALGLTGEAGEVAELFKKHHGHGHELDRAKLVKELGDVLWYIAALAKSVDATLEEVAQANVEKLKARYPHGFTVEASKHNG